MKKYSLKFWITFWVLSAVFLIGWYFFWQIKRGGSSGIADLPLGTETNLELKALSKFADYILEKDGVEKTFMVLFQNNMEIRPGGGYIGSFGIVKVKNGEVTLIQTHDLSNFDGRIPDTVKPPYPMEETLHIKSWKLRDSNWFPDWPTNAKKAEEFYYMGQGKEKFDGIIAINTGVLASFLKVTGPVTLSEYSKTFDSENAILELEYEVEQQYAKDAKPRGERKSIMTPLAEEIMKKVGNLDLGKKIELAKIIRQDLYSKDIQLYFKDPELQREAELAGWAGKMPLDGNNDYLMMVDANLGALKSDYYIRREFNYSLDFRSPKPRATLKVTYNHTAKRKDWMTTDYLTYLRVYVPKGSWLVSSQNTGQFVFGEEFNKKYFGTLVSVPLGRTKTVELTYDLPSSLSAEDYNLMIEKQSGSGTVVGKVIIIFSNGSNRQYDINLNRNWVLNNQ